VPVIRMRTLLNAAAALTVTLACQPSQAKHTAKKQKTAATTPSIPDCASATVSSSDPKFPFQCSHQQIIDNNQDGLVTVVVNADGQGKATFRFSNGAVFTETFKSAPKFSIEAALETAGGKLLLVVRKSVLMDNPGGGPTNVVTQTIDFTLNSQKLAAFDRVYVPQMHAAAETKWSIQVTDTYGDPSNSGNSSADNPEDISLGPPEFLDDGTASRNTPTPPYLLAPPYTNRFLHTYSQLNLTCFKTVLVCHPSKAARESAQKIGSVGPSDAKKSGTRGSPFRAFGTRRLSGTKRLV
jgi:hypothetical protein